MPYPFSMAGSPLSSAMLFPTLQAFHLPLPADGPNRAPIDACLITAKNDAEAIQLFLREYQGSKETLRAYTKEVERFFFWSILEQRKALSDLTREDLLSYQQFLSDPKPAERWCGPKGGRHCNRLNSQWRPFVGPLGPSAQKSALVIIHTLFHYLVHAGYLKGNPLALMKRRRSSKNSLQQSKRAIRQRSFNQLQWQIIVDLLKQGCQQQENQKYHLRNRFLVALLYFLALRIGEVASHGMQNFQNIRGKWYFYVIGKGQKEAELPVNDFLLEALRDYRLSLGLPAFPQPQEPWPLIMTLGPEKQGICTRQLSYLIKELVQQAANELMQKDQHQADAMRQASPHWFRHTSISHRAMQGGDVLQLKHHARHEKLDTTMLYVHADEDEQFRLAQKHGWKQANNEET